MDIRARVKTTLSKQAKSIILNKESNTEMRMFSNGNYQNISSWLLLRSHRCDGDC
ncbi:hypothetical protein LMQOC1_30996 [Listeria monocytogenes QOC1]|nr:hypothetical protein LMQOC1_30996 [Listeria monocytogenes QOC1]